MNNIITTLMYKLINNLINFKFKAYGEEFKLIFGYLYTVYMYIR